MASHRSAVPKDEKTVSVKAKESLLIWVDDSVKNDPTAKEIFRSLYDKVDMYTNCDDFLQAIESMDNDGPIISVLITGRFGQILVRDHLEPKEQVRDIYVFCCDVEKHRRWASGCSKVRCVVQELDKVFQYMQFDQQNGSEVKVKHSEKVSEMPPEDEEEEEEMDVSVEMQRERFTDDNNLFVRLAFFLIQKSSDDAGEDFDHFCEEFDEKKISGKGKEDRMKYLQTDQKIRDWYKPDLPFLQINSFDLPTLWAVRGFLRPFHQQIVSEHSETIENQTKFKTFYLLRLSKNELDGLKHRIGQTIIITESMMTYLHQNDASQSLHDSEGKETTSKEYSQKVLFELIVDPTVKGTVPYAMLDNDRVIFWFGARFRVRKLEYADEENFDWTISLKLCATNETTPATEQLLEYYQNELIKMRDMYQAFGRLLIYKGSYFEAAKWFEKGKYDEELAEIAIRIGQWTQATKYLERIPNTSRRGDLLRAYYQILISKEGISLPRRILLKLSVQCEDQIIKSQSCLALGYLNFVYAENVDQAMDYFIIAQELLQKTVPEIHPLLAKSLICIGYAHYARQNTVEAKKCFEEAFHIQKQSLTYNHPSFASTRSALARCLFVGHNGQSHALAELEYALNILRRTYGHKHKNHPEIKATMKDIEYVRKGKALPIRTTLLDYI